MTDPGPAIFQRPQAPFLRQLCFPASVSSLPKAAFEWRAVAPLKDPRVTHAVPTGTGESLRTMHTAMNRAPQGQGEGCQDTPAVECPWLPGSWHLIWATQPKGSSTPRGRQLSGLLICLAPPPWAKGSWEREGAESLAPRLGSSCGIHREDGRLVPSGIRLPVGVAMCQSAEDAPEGSRGPAVKSPGFRGNCVWVESLALCPVSLCPHLRNGDNEHPFVLLAWEGVPRTVASADKC